MTQAIGIALIAMIAGALLGIGIFYKFLSSRLGHQPVSNSANLPTESEVYERIYYFGKDGRMHPLLLTTHEWDRAHKRTGKNPEDT